MSILGVHSSFSLMRGTASPRAIVNRAADLGYRALALTDVNNIYGLWHFRRACLDAGIRPIIGADLRADDGRAFLLVKDKIGYRNLCRLLTRRADQSNPLNLAGSDAEQFQGLAFLAASPIFLDHFAQEDIDLYAAIGGRVDSRSQALRNRARELKVRPAALADSYYLSSGDAPIGRLLRAIDLNKTISDISPDEYPDDRAYLPTPSEMIQRFETIPEALDNCAALAEQCSYPGPSGSIIFPSYSDRHGRESVDALREDVYRGARDRYGDDLGEATVDRIEHELKIIHEKGFAEYFLVVRDIVALSPRICGRGSGAASILAYCLNITNVCPIKFNLYFDRFLNPGRTDPPDIDVDFAWDERDEVLDSVLKIHQGKAAMVANFVTFRPRMAIRETAKVYGLTATEIGKLTKRLPWFWKPANPHTGLEERIRGTPETSTIETPDPWPEILRLAEKLVGLPRHLSVHCGGVVITPGPISDFVPIEKAPKGVPIICWDKDGAEDSGLVKIDLLGNRSLGVIRDAIENFSANGGVFDENNWEPEDDPETIKAVAAGNTIGCFYIESPATRQLQIKTGRGDYEHLVIASSIIRPAANVYINEYIRRLRGGDYQPIHPLLEETLAETYGIMVYQEDVSRAAMALAGFSSSEADGLRKIISKKDRQLEIDDYHRRFIGGALAAGATREKAEEVWQMIQSFSGYSFCKPHSASYARVSFQAAYLKTHFPAEFMAAVISNHGGFYSTFAYVSEARRLGLKVLPPNVNLSRERWRGLNNKVRVGLSSIKGVSAKTRERIYRAREDRPFDSIGDLLDRGRPDEDEARMLIYSGACDRFDPEANQTKMLWRAIGEKAGKGNKEPQLFASTQVAAPAGLTPPDLLTRLRRQFIALGFLCDRHPIVLFEKQLAGYRLTKARDLSKKVGMRVNFGGWMITGKTVRTKAGDPMRFVTFEDETGIIETTFFPEAYLKFCRLPDDGRPLILGGAIDEHYGAISLTVDEIRTLPRRQTDD